MSRTLLKEAIADAKAVKEAAIANAKAALEEAFTPHLKELLAAKLENLDENMDEESEMEAEGMKKSMEEIDLDEILAELDGLDEDRIKTARETDNINSEEGDDPFDAGRSKNQPMDEAKKKESEDEESEEGEEGAEMNMEDMTEEDLKKLIEDVIEDMVAAGDLEGGEGKEGKEGEGMEDDEEIDMNQLMNEMMNEFVDNGPSSDNALLKAIDAAINKGANLTTDMLKKIKTALTEQQELNEYVEGGVSSDNALIKAIDAAISKGVTLSTKALKAIKSALANGGGGWQQGGIYEKDEMMNEMQGGAELAGAMEILAGVLLGGGALAYGIEKAKKAFPKLAAKLDAIGSAAGGAAHGKAGLGDKSTPDTTAMKDELNEAYSTIKTLRADLNEVNLLNAKLLYTNKIFKAKNLTESQKVKVLSTFDRATTVKEVKLVFESLNTSMTTANTAKAPIKESMGGFASKAAGSVKRETIETDAVIARMKKLAGL